MNQDLDANFRDKETDASLPVQDMPPYKKPKCVEAISTTSNVDASLDCIATSGGQGNLLRITPDIIGQIGVYLSPQDMLAMAKTTKLIRGIFLKRSFRHVWVAAIANVDGLPDCPPTISEPHYVALIFTSICSKCSQEWPDNALLDPNILVRLCKICYPHSIINCENIASEIKALINTTQDSRFCLYGEVAKAMDVLEGLGSTGDEVVLRSWMKGKESEIMQWRQHATQLALFMNNNLRQPLQPQYIISTESPWSIHKRTRAQPQVRSKTRSRARMSAAKSARHAEIKRRLLALGWSPDDMIFPKDKESQWMIHFNYDTPLTDRHWNKILPKLTILLQINTKERLDREKFELDTQQQAERKEARQVRLRTLWEMFQNELVSLTQLSMAPQNLAQAALAISRLVPIPELSDALAWPSVQHLLETNFSISALDAQFLQERKEILKEAQRWGVETKTLIINVLRGGLSRSGYAIEGTSVQMIADGAANSSFNDLTPEMQLSIRADSLFGYYSAPPGDPGYSFDEYIKSLRCFTDDHNKANPLDVNRFKFNFVALLVTRTLLRFLGRPENTSIMELRLLDERFVCGRCDDHNPKSWIEMVNYYVKRETEWEWIKDRTTKFAAMGVEYNRIHDLKSENNRPPIRKLSSSERATMESARSSNVRGKDWILLECNFCDRARASAKTMIRPHMLNHLRDVHGVDEPLLADPDVRLLEVYSDNYSLLDPNHPYHDYYGYGSHKGHLMSDEENGSDVDSDY